MVGCFGRGTWLVCFVEVAVAGVGNIGHQGRSLAGGYWGATRKLCNPVLVETMLATAKSSSA